jgi:hypothetical protein
MRIKLLARTASGALLLGSCLQAGAASALSFNFSWTGQGVPTSPATVTGYIDGLLDNVSGQTTGLTVTITSATNSPAGDWPSFTDLDFNPFNDPSVIGFDVSGGQVIKAQGFWRVGDGTSKICLWSGGSYCAASALSGFDPAVAGSLYVNDSSPGTLVITPRSPVPAVPGPLPALGVAAAFGYSRKLRNRIKKSGNSASSAFTL